MIIVTEYTAVYDKEKRAHRIAGTAPALCPACGVNLSGYDTRLRHTIDMAGDVHRLLLRRLRCPRCNKLHTEIPAFVMPKKHYEADVIKSVLAGCFSTCPADNSTIRRWGRG